MLFSSWTFVAFFLPVTWGVFQWLLTRAGRGIALSWLMAASLFFYGWFRPEYVFIILASTLFNFLLGTWLSRPRRRKVHKNRVLGFGIAANLLALGYYKYTGFIFETANTFGAGLDVPEIVLPLAISFFTFTQIAYLVDAYRGAARELNFRHYLLFVNFFPHLIAGPIVHHRELIPQFGKLPAKKIGWDLLAPGLTVFAFGLFKKLVIADHMAEIADPAFTAASLGVAMTLFEAWAGVLAYTLQIYFDFSGYSDMAIGLSLLFGVKMPVNFLSPYKAGSIIDFWRRWHITLSRFLRDYLYIPLGGNRKGPMRRYFNLFLTMVLAGFWHGASWTFIFWGALHGVYLMVNHAWRALRIPLPRLLGWALTFLAVMFGWIFFRAESFSAALHMLECLGGKNGVALSNPGNFVGDALKFMEVDVARSTSRLLRLNEKWYLLFFAFLLAVRAPSVHEIMDKKTAIDPSEAARGLRAPDFLLWKPSMLWAIGLGLMAGCALLFMNRVNAFIYFQF